MGLWLVFWVIRGSIRSNMRRRNFWAFVLTFGIDTLNSRVYLDELSGQIRSGFWGKLTSNWEAREPATRATTPTALWDMGTARPTRTVWRVFVGTLPILVRNSLWDYLLLLHHRRIDETSTQYLTTVSAWWTVLELGVFRYILGQQFISVSSIKSIVSWLNGFARISKRVWLNHLPPYCRPLKLSNPSPFGHPEILLAIACSIAPVSRQASTRLHPSVEHFSSSIALASIWLTGAMCWQLTAHWARAARRLADAIPTHWSLRLKVVIYLVEEDFARGVILTAAARGF